MAWSAQGSSKTYPRYRWSSRTTYVGKTGPTTDPASTGYTLAIGAGSIAFDPNTRIGYYKIASVSAVMNNSNFYTAGLVIPMVAFPTDGSIPTDVTNSDQQTLSSGGAQPATLVVSVQQAGVTFAYTFGNSNPGASNLSGWFFLDA